MNSTYIKKIELMNNIALIPNNKLEEVSNYINSFLKVNKIPEKKTISVWGDWESLKINFDEFEKDLKDLRKEIEINILKKMSDN